MKNKYLIIIISLIILIFTSDFIFLTINKKPLILINKQDEKYSSIFYNVYDCNGEKVITTKFSKYNCKVKANDNLDNKNDDKTNQDDTKQDDNSNNNKDNNNNNNNDNNNTNGNKNDNNNSNDKKDDIIKDNPIIDNRIDDNIIGSNKKITIIDRSSGNCPQAIEYYYEDSNYKYYFTCVISSSIFVKIDNQEYNIKYALNNKIVTMDELIEAGFKPLKKSKNTSAY